MRLVETSRKLLNEPFFSEYTKQLQELSIDVMCLSQSPTDTVIAGYLNAKQFKFTTYLNDPDLSVYFGIPS